MTDETTARDEQEGCTCSMGSSCPYCERVLRNRQPAPTADVAADLPARLRAAADEAWEIRGITAAIKLGELARTLDKYPADAVEAIARVLAAAAPEGAPTADVAECPTPMHHPLTVCPICHPAAPEDIDYRDGIR